jgi:hypothetical protein
MQCVSEVAVGVLMSASYPVHCFLTAATQKDIMDELLAVLGPVGTQLMLNDTISNNSGGAAAVQPLPLRSTTKMGAVSDWHNAEADAHQRSSMLGVLDSYLRQQHVAIVGSSNSSSNSSSSGSSSSKGKKGKASSDSSDSKRSTAMAAVLSILSQSMEDNLYRAARDAAEFSNIATLRTRVQWLAQQFCAVLQLSDVATDDSKQGKRKRSSDTDATAAADDDDDGTEVGDFFISATPCHFMTFMVHGVKALDSCPSADRNNSNNAYVHLCY